MRVNKSLITFQQTGAGTGSVTSVAMTVPTGLTISGSPITSSGTLVLGFASGVALPPSQTGNAGKYLTTDGTNLSWATVSGTNIYNSDGTLTADRTITNNGFYLRLLNTETIASGSVTRLNFGLGNTLTNNGTGVVTGQSISGGITLIGTLSNSIVRSSNSLSATRNNASDISSSASSSFQGLGITHNHLPPASTSIVTASVLGVQHSVNARTGTMNNVWSFYSSYFISPFGGDSNASVGNFYGLFITGRVGQASGPTASLTNFYGVYIDTPLVGATGTITNRWGIYAPDSAMNHYINGITSIGTTTINGSAILQLNSTSRGFLPPRMTNAERTAISSPAVGLIVYCTDATEGLYVYKSGGWTFII